MELLLILLSGAGDFLGTPIFDSENFWKLITKTVFKRLMFFMAYTLAVLF